MTITLLTASFIGLLAFILSYNVSRIRMKTKTSLGVGEDNKPLLAASRAHANLMENAPIILILLGLLEYMRVSIYLLLGVGIIFTIARVLHAYGITREKDINPPRFMGALLNYLVLLVVVIAGLLKGYQVI